MIVSCLEVGLRGFLVLGGLSACGLGTVVCC